MVGSLAACAHATARRASGAVRRCRRPPKRSSGRTTKVWRSAPRLPDNAVPILAAKDGDSPPGVTPISRDIYKDRVLWADPRYSGCNSANEGFRLPFPAGRRLPEQLSGCRSRRHALQVARVDTQWLSID